MINHARLQEPSPETAQLSGLQPAVLQTIPDNLPASAEGYMKKARRLIKQGEMPSAYQLVAKLLDAEPGHLKAQDLMDFLQPGFSLPQEEVPPYRVQLASAANGEPNLKVIPLESGRAIPLHHPKAPLAEARAAVAPYRLGRAQAVLLAGLGLGYPLEAVLEATDPERPVFVIERRVLCYLQYFQMNRNGNGKGTRRLRCLIGVMPEAAADWIFRRLEGQPIKVVYHHQSLCLDGNYYFELVKQLAAKPRYGSWLCSSGNGRPNGPRKYLP